MSGHSQAPGQPVIPAFPHILALLPDGEGRADFVDDLPLSHTAGGIGINAHIGFNLVSA